MSGFYEAVYALVRQVPSGRVTSYGAVARMLGQPRAARAVGYALHALLPGSDVPWHRVLNAGGTISGHGRSVEACDEQRRRLLAEGITFDAGGRVDWALAGWGPVPGTPRP